MVIAFTASQLKALQETTNLNEVALFVQGFVRNHSTTVAIVVPHVPIMQMDEGSETVYAENQLLASKQKFSAFDFVPIIRQVKSLAGRGGGGSIKEMDIVNKIFFPLIHSPKVSQVLFFKESQAYGGWRYVREACLRQCKNKGETFVSCAVLSVPDEKEVA